MIILYTHAHYIIRSHTIFGNNPFLFIKTTRIKTSTFLKYELAITTIFTQNGKYYDLKK